MPQAIIYVFKGERNISQKAAHVFPFMFDKAEELDKQLWFQMNASDAVYHVVAYNTYGQLLLELYRSSKTKGKIV